MTDLQVSVESLEGLQRRMTVTIPASNIEQEVSVRLEKVGRNAKLKGFRPGKAPEKVIRQHYGVQVREEVLSDLIQSTYSAAIEKENLRPAALPTLEQGQTEVGADFAYSATFEIYPEIELAKFDDMKVERAETEIGAADVDEMIDTLREQRADWTTVDRPAADGDKVTVDFDGKINGEPVTDGTGTDVEIILGKGRMLEEFEKNIPGMSATDEKSFDVTFAEDYQAEELAGKTANFTVTVKSVAEQQLPELDADFVKTFGVESGDVEAFRADVCKNMEREAAAMILADVKRQVMEQLLEANPIDIPAALTEREAESLRSEALRKLGVTDEKADDPRVPPIDAYRDAAERRVRLGLLIGAVIEDNGLSVDRERVKDKVDEICAPYDKPEEFKKLYFQNPQLLEQVESVVLEEQVVEWLVAQAELTVSPKAFSELRNG